MFGLLEGIFGLIRPGLLGSPQETLDSKVTDLEATPGWSLAVARASSSSQDPAKLAAEFEALLWHIKDTKNTVSVTLVRRYIEMVDQMQKLAAGAAPAPPTPPPAPAPTPPPAPAPVPKALPPAPPGIKCPHYTQSSAFPVNWNDPAAEGRYLDSNPDVRMWVDAMKKRKELNGQLNALWHYRCYGAKENRTWAGLDGTNIRLPGYL